MELPLSQAALRDGEAVAFVRPHELALASDDEPGIPVAVLNVLTAGPMLRIDFERQNGDTLEAALPQQMSPLKKGDSARLKLLAQRLFSA